MRFTTRILALAASLLALARPTAAWDDGYGATNNGDFTVHIRSNHVSLGKVFEIFYSGRAARPAMTTKMSDCDRTSWFHAYPEFLPHKIAVRGGPDYCARGKQPVAENLLEIKYQEQLLQVQFDSRCKHIDKDMYFDHWRCTIALGT